jgi:hypothetical protein
MRVDNAEFDQVIFKTQTSAGTSILRIGSGLGGEIGQRLLQETKGRGDLARRHVAPAFGIFDERIEDAARANLLSLAAEPVAAARTRSRHDAVSGLDEIE